MKTKEQILEWLDKQPWKGEFYEATFLCDNIVVGRVFSKYFICHAFDWGKTKQGESVWEARNEEYLKWYNAKDKPMSWEEYCRQNPAKEDDWFISGACGILKCNGKRERGTTADINVMSKELCEAFLTYMKLMQLRNAWVKNENLEELPNTYKILYQDGEFDVFRGHTSTGLSFVSKEDAKEFAETFRELLNIAKPLL